MTLNVREYPLLFSKSKCDDLGIDTVELFEGRIMHGTFYASDQQDFLKKSHFTETMIDGSLKESFLITKPHLVNRVLKKVTSWYRNVDRRTDELPIRAICNHMVNRGLIQEFNLPGTGGGMFSVLCHGQYKTSLERVEAFVLECMDNDDGTKLARLRMWTKIREIIDLSLAQRFPEDWDKLILDRFNYLGLVQIGNDKPVTPLSAFP